MKDELFLLGLHTPTTLTVAQQRDKILAGISFETVAKKGTFFRNSFRHIISSLCKHQNKSISTNQNGKITDRKGAFQLFDLS
jgi:hypothetical protein